MPVSRIATVIFLLPIEMLLKAPPPTAEYHQLLSVFSLRVANVWVISGNVDLMLGMEKVRRLNVVTRTRAVGTNRREMKSTLAVLCQLDLWNNKRLSTFVDLLIDVVGWPPCSRFLHEYWLSSQILLNHFRVSRIQAHPAESESSIGWMSNRDYTR